MLKFIFATVSLIFVLSYSLILSPAQEIHSDDELKQIKAGILLIIFAFHSTMSFSKIFY